MAYASYAACAANVLRVSNASNVFIATAMCANPGAASGHISAKRGGNARNIGDCGRNCANRNNQREIQRQQLNEMKGQP